MHETGQGVRLNAGRGSAETLGSHGSICGCLLTITSFLTGDLCGGKRLRELMESYLDSECHTFQTNEAPTWLSTDEHCASYTDTSCQLVAQWLASLRLKSADLTLARDRRSEQASLKRLIEHRPSVAAVSRRGRKEHADPLKTSHYREVNLRV